MIMSESLAFLASVFGPFGAAHAIEEAALLATEGRLKVALPAALRTLYRVTGAALHLHHAHNQLTEVDRVDFAGDHLVFYEENQAVVVWGIARGKLQEEDPPVDQGQFDAERNAWTFYPEFRSVSQFAAAQGAWQAVQGGLRYVGVKEFDEEAAANARVSLSRQMGTPSLETATMRAGLVDGGVAVDAVGALIGLATREPPQFSSACERMGIPIEAWDYATLRDE